MPTNWYILLRATSVFILAWLCNRHSDYLYPQPRNFGVFDVPDLDDICIAR